METQITREQALALLKTYNKDPFHIQQTLDAMKACEESVNTQMSAE